MGTDKEQYQGEPSDGLPQDQESDTEYDRAVAAPQSFTGKDLSKITTYDDLTGEMLSVGKGIQSIVGPGGTIEGSVLISKPYHGRATILPQQKRTWHSFPYIACKEQRG
jgi:hypothetical protein